ncbi:MAG: hypothetical protein ABIQ52_08565 [Vicinamibacterales bacterium]
MFRRSALVLTWMMLPLTIGAMTPQSTTATNKLSTAFEQYELMRSALAVDSLTGVSEAATALAPIAREVGGEGAEAAARRVASAKTIKDAREHFGTLSELLVPKFLAARLPGVRGFTCSMVKKPWAQKGATTQNPYYGKSMPTCGTPIAK